MWAYASDHQFVGDAAYINLEIEALHWRARENLRTAHSKQFGLVADRLARCLVLDLGVELGAE